jgi:hypothetical protein
MKASGSYLAAALIATVFASVEVMAAAPVPVLDIGFEEVTADGEFVDSSGGGHAAFCNPYPNGCLRLEETADSAYMYPYSGWLDVANGFDLNPGTDFTIALWVAPFYTHWFGADKAGKLFGKVNSAFNRGYLLGVEPSGDSSMTLFAEVWNSAGKRYSVKAGVIPLRKWSHVAVTWHTGGKMIAYVNGVAVGSVAAGTKPVGQDTSPVVIGAAPWDTLTFHYLGLLDEVRFYKAALTAKQILALAAQR